MKENKNKCSICGEKLVVEKVILCRGYKYKFCNLCKGAALYPREKVLRIAREKYNTQEYFTWNNKSTAKKYLNNIKLSESYSEWVSRSLAGKKKLKILDIGAGIPTFVEQMTKLGFNAYALEPSKKQAKLIAKYIGKNKVYNSFFEKFIVKEHHFNVLTFWHVLEHVEDLDKTLKKINRILEKGGSVFLEVPNARSLTWQLFGDSYELLAVPEHPLYFSEESLKKAFTKHGFNVEEISYPLKYISVFSLSLSRKFNKQLLYYLSLPISLLLNLIMVLTKRSEVIRMKLVKVTS